MGFNHGKISKEQNKKLFPWGNLWHPFKKGLNSRITETFNSQNIATSLHSMAYPVLLSLTDIINIVMSSVANSPVYLE